jgi:hypothetical protein
MKFVVGYDRALAVQCFRRNLYQMIRPGRNPMTTISELEVDYFSERLAETSVFNLSDSLGNPWMCVGDVTELTKLPVKKANRRHLQSCEDVANKVLIVEGIISRAGALQNMDQERGEILLKRIKIAEALFRKASFGKFHSEKEIIALRRMSSNVFDWIRWLSFLPGNDFMDLLSTVPSQHIHTQ